MLQFFESLFLGLIRWYFTQGYMFAVLTLGVAGGVLIFIQFMKQSDTKIPGAIGIICFGLLVFRLFAQDNLLAVLDGMMVALETPHAPKPVPIVEPLFAIFVGSAEYRTLFEEVLFVLLATYLGFVAKVSFDEYKKTGRLLGEFDVKNLFNSDFVRPKRSDSNELGSGDLASTTDIASLTKVPAPDHKGRPMLYTTLRVQELRGSEGVAFKDTSFKIPEEFRNRHMLMVAKTGGGKTTSFILPVLYEDCLCNVRSTIVIDSKPEMWGKLANFTRQANPEKNIILFNPLDTARSLSWNILGKIEDDTDAKLIANTIIMATDNPSAKSDSPFFRNNALAILNAVMVGLLHDKEEILSMPRIHELIQSGMKPLCDWLEQHPHALRTSRTFVELARSGSQNADTIMSELGMRIAAWDLKAIRSTTWQDELDIAKLVEEPTLFIVELRESELEMLRPMANVIVVELLRYLTKYAESCKGHRLPRPVGFVIDEFASALGRLPDIHVKLNTLRSRRVSIVAAIQSIAQVKANYGDDSDSVLAGFNTKVFLPPLDLQDAEWASKESGQMTIRFQTASTGSNRKVIEWFASKNDGTQEQVQQRAVLTPDEIGRSQDGLSTFFFPNMQPFQGKLVPFFKVPEMLQRIQDSEDAPELRLREEPIEIDEELPAAGPAQGGGQQAAPGGPPPGISNTSGWTEDQIRDKLEEVKKKLDWDNTTGSARKWWEAFENENKHRVALVLRLAEELANRNATITEFFLAYVYSNTDNIQANLHYLDYTRLKKEEERKKKEAAAKAKGEAAPAGAANGSGAAAAGENPPAQAAVGG